MNTLTRGGENFLLAAFPTILKPLQLHMEEGKSEANEEGAEGCSTMEKVLDGIKKGKKVGGQKKRLILMWKKQTLR